MEALFKGCNLKNYRRRGFIHAAALVFLWTGLCFLTRAEAHDPNLTAVFEYSDILEKDPDNLEALRARGSTYRALELYDNALIDLKRVDELQPGDPETIAEIGICHYSLGERDQATKRMDQADKLLAEKIRTKSWDAEKYEPIERELREYRFRNFRDQERFEEALAESVLLEKYLSGKLSFMCDVADMLLEMNRAAEALERYEEAVEANCAFERYCVGAANCCLILDRPEDALHYFEAWKTDDPTAALPYLHEGVILKNYLQDGERARAALARAEEMFHQRIDGEEEPDLEDVIHLARVLQAAGRHEESFALLETLIEDFRGHWLVVHLQGLNSAALGREREALSFERESLLYKRLNPRDWLQAYEIFPPPETPVTEPKSDASSVKDPSSPVQDEGPVPVAWLIAGVIGMLLVAWLVRTVRR